MFRGNHPAKVDEKGRLKLPAAFKQLLDAQHVTQFYVTSEDGVTAKIWPLPEWEKWEVKLAQHGTMNDAVQKYLNLTSYYGQQVEMDSQSRILLPQVLREDAKLDAEVDVMGKINVIEVHNHARFKADMAANAMSAEERKSVAEIYSGRS